MLFFSIIHIEVLIMDIDKIQKINEMARELLKHGIVSSMDDAVKQAEECVSKKTEASQLRTDVESDNEKKHSMSLEINRLKSKISEQARKIDELEGMLKKANEKITDLELRKSSTIMEKDKSQPQTRLVPEEKKPHPRSGNFVPGDVSIEKIFYSGPK